MGVLDDLFGATTLIDLDGPRLSGRRARKLLETGERATAVVVGIAVTRVQLGEHASNANDFAFAYALDVRTPGGVRRLGVRQRLGNERWRAHVGAELDVAVQDDRVIVDWQRTESRWGAGERPTNTDSWKTLDEPPAPGVADRSAARERKQLEQAEPAEAVLVALHGTAGLGFGVSTTTVDLDVVLHPADGRVLHHRAKRVNPPDYARHRLEPGVVLRVGVDAGRPERMLVDWLALANEAPRRLPVPAWEGEAPRERREPDATAIGTRIAAAFGVTVPDPNDTSAGQLPPPPSAAAAHGASFDRWIELKAGLEWADCGRRGRDAWVAAREPAVTSWKELDRHWTTAMQRDLELERRYFALYPAAVKAGGPGGAGATFGA